MAFFVSGSIFYFTAVFESANFGGLPGPKDPHKSADSLRHGTRQGIEEERLKDAQI